jgi:hypothetical protein
MNKHGELVQEHTYFRVIYKEPPFGRIERYDNIEDLPLEDDFLVISVWDIDAGLQEYYDDVAVFKEEYGDWL